MSEPDPPGDDLWLDRVRVLPGTEEKLRILVLGDPAARTCRMLEAKGHLVACCPDQQATAGGLTHRHVLRERAADLVGVDDSFDVVVAIDGWQRLRQTNTPDTVDALVTWMQQHTRVTVVEASRRVLAPDLNDLGPFEVLPLLGRFSFLAEATTGTRADARTPIILASDVALLADGEWIAASEVTWMGGHEPDARSAPVRTYRVPGGRIVKVECTSEDYFERAQVVGEAAFLESVGEVDRAAIGPPRVLSFVRGRAVVTLVREELPGDPLPDAQGRLDGVLDIAARYASLGLFHNDLRPWNVIWADGRSLLIDFADTSAYDDDVRDLPQVLALAGTLAALATEEIRAGESFHIDVLEIAAREGLLTRWPLAEQLTQPWLSLPDRRAALRIRAGMTAPQIMRSVLEGTCG